MSSFEKEHSSSQNRRQDSTKSMQSVRLLYASKNYVEGGFMSFKKVVGLFEVFKKLRIGATFTQQLISECKIQHAAS